MTRVLGIDPGSRITGYGIIDFSDNKAVYVVGGCLKLGSGPLVDRLVEIYRYVSNLVEEYQVDLLGIEDVFVKRNVRSALVLGQARGSAIVAARNAGLTVLEHAPRQIKQTVTGTGSATKAQVQFMIKQLLNLTTTPPSDAADALAVAFTAFAEFSNSKPRAIE